ncbi:(R)-1-hydroxy-2-trimethylaminoethylphosphonate oxygenase [Roseibium sp.]|uniref:(R)-1-hydroxy-2-trimethylaminoethylphosphonate oxygenase n=1 Tax=Roseibium sp. TaxID=1936156 RepID=UPI003B521746
MTKPDFSILTQDNIVAFLGDIFERCGDEEYLGEPVTMAQHMLQGATIAEENGLEEDIIVGALLHDIGHFTSEFGTFSMNDTEDRYHEEAGAEVLSAFFPSVITDCVRYHVAAKRYLCATKPDYFDRLSDASVHSLNLQGGPMSEEEVAEFEKNPNLKKIIQVRYLDEAGKRADMQTPDFWHFAPMVQKIVDGHMQTLAAERTADADTEREAG